MCTYNGARFLREQLLSVLNQSLPISELVVSDDGSTDDTLAVVREVLDVFGSTHRAPALVVLHNETPLGVAANFEQAIRTCSGAIIALADQDDLWHADRLERMVGVFESRPDLLLLHSDARMVDETGVPLGYTLFEALAIDKATKVLVHEGLGFVPLMRRNLVTGSTTVIRAELARAALPIPAGWLHDEWLAVVAGSIARFDMLDETTIDYRQHGNNQIGQLKSTLRYRVRRLLQPRTQRNARLLARATSLAKAITGYGPSVPGSYLELTQDKLKHEVVRSSYARGRLRRIPAVLREQITGRYVRFGRGWEDAVRDLLQSAQ